MDAQTCSSTKQVNLVPPFFNVKAGRVYSNARINVAWRSNFKRIGTCAQGNDTRRRFMSKHYMRQATTNTRTWRVVVTGKCFTLACGRPQPKISAAKARFSFQKAGFKDSGAKRSCPSIWIQMRTQLSVNLCR